MVCMKRQNLMIDENLLHEAKKMLGLSTFSETVNLALAEAVRVEKIKKMSALFGKIKWEGNLDEMRGRRTETKLSKNKRVKAT